MSQKTILSFFKSTEQSSSKDVKKSVVIEDSSVKKKLKRKVQCIDSDEDTKSANKSESNSTKTVKVDKKDKSKSSRKRHKANENEAQEINDLNTRKSEKHENEDINKENEPSDDKMEVDDGEKGQECSENGDIDISSKTTEEVKTNDNEINQTESVNFIPKRKTARKQINSPKLTKVPSPTKSINKSDSKSVKKEDSNNDSNLTNGNSSKEEIEKCNNEVDDSKKSSDSDDVKKNDAVENKKSSKDLKPKQKSKTPKKRASPKKPDKKESLHSFFTPLKKSEDDVQIEKDTGKKEIQNQEVEIDDSPIKKTAKSKKKVQCLESDDEDMDSPEEATKAEIKNSKVVNKISDLDKKSDKNDEVEKENKVEMDSSKQDDKTSDVDKKSDENDEVEKENEDVVSPEVKAKKSKSKKSTTKKSADNEAKMDEKPKLDVKSSSASTTVYDPSKSHYHPIEDACWKKGEKVPYLALAKTLECIENTSGRLKAIETLSNYLRSVIVLSPDDLLQSVYLCLNRIAPEYEAIELGVGETLLMKAVAQATGRTVEKIKAEVAVKGDLGLVSESSRGNQRVMFAPPKLTVSSVFNKFYEIAKMSGNAAMTKKTDKIQSLFVACRDCEARFIIRSLSGKLRIGLAEQSVLSALGRAAVLTPPGQSYPPEKIDASKGKPADSFKEFLDSQTLILKTAYCECPNYDLIIPILLEKGISALPDNCQLSPGRPLKPMLAHPTTGIDIVLQRFDKNAFTCEYKYDGERAQIHMNEKGEVKIFSRNQEDNTSKYPDVISRISKCIKETTKSFILDTEAVAWDTETKQILPFQALSTRKRKDAVESEIVVKVCIMAFDLLYLNDESLVKKPLKERRSLLHSSFNEVENEFMFAQYRDGDSAETMQEFLDESVKGNCEGLMVKALEVDASYEIAKRSHNWLKLKKDYLQGCGDTMDLAVIGGYYGKGKRTGTYGGFLLACYDDDNEEFQTICKLGVGFKNEDLETHTSFLKQHVIKEPKPYYRYDHGLEPDVWFDAVQVWEIKCADLSISPVHKAAMGIVDPEKGISLRFPRYIRIRDDKTPVNCTNSTQIADMYKQQQQIQNTNKNAKTEEDYY